jgi:hypothetical protein
MFASRRQNDKKNMFGNGIGWTNNDVIEAHDLGDTKC